VRQPAAQRIPEAAPTVLAIDAGQTGTRARLGGGGPVGEGPGVGHLGAPGQAERTADAICAAAEAAAAGPGGEVGLLVAGVTGYVDRPPVLERVARRIRAHLGPVGVVLASDVVTAFLGALGGRPGVVVAAGTGTVVLAAGERGAPAVVDGTGPLLGDAGSGFAIGRAGLDQALRAHDGRGGSLALRDAAQRALGPLPALPAAIQVGGAPVETIAGFARVVAEVARAGDPVARAIWREAGEELAASVAAAARRAFGPAPGADVSWTGRLFAADDLLGVAFRRALADRAPGLRPVAPVGTGLDGALALARPGAVERFPGLARRLA
jgi:glucosamine kinase